MKGIIACELHADGSPHFHLLIFNDPIYKDSGISLKDAFVNEFKIPKHYFHNNKKGFQVFNSNGVKFKPIYSHDAIDYNNKDIKLNGYQSYGFLSKNGIVGLI